MPLRARLRRVVVVLAAGIVGTPSFGGALRRHNTVLAAAALNLMTIVVMAPAASETCAAMAATYGVPVVTPPTSLLERSRLRRAAAVVLDPARPTPPRWRKGVEQWIAPHLANADLAVVDLLRTYLAVAPALDLPTIVDLDNLEDQRLDQRIDELDEQLATAPSGWSGVRRRVTLHARRLADRERRRRWRQTTAQCQGSVRTVLVCSEDDRLRVPDPAKARVIPNGYEPSREPVGSVEVRQPPTVSFVAHFGYPPNAEGADWFVHHVWPLIRAQRPDIQALMVGLRSELLALPSAQAVTATGWVDDPVDMLARTDVVVVPLHRGVGTRIKIIEAWAYGLPIVSTTIGAYGLDATDGDDLLLADSSTAFAEAVLQLVGDTGLRERLREHGLRRAADLTWERSRQELVRVMAEFA